MSSKSNCKHRQELPRPRLVPAKQPGESSSSVPLSLGSAFCPVLSVGLAKLQASSFLTRAGARLPWLPSVGRFLRGTCGNGRLVLCSFLPPVAFRSHKKLTTNALRRPSKHPSASIALNYHGTTARRVPSFKVLGSSTWRHPSLLLPLPSF